MDDNFNDSDIELGLQALIRPASSSSDDLTLPPTDGYQYLRRVINEAKKCEGILVANIDVRPQSYSASINAEGVKQECDNHFFPRKSWQMSAVKEFSQLRLDLISLHQKYFGSQLDIIEHSLPPTNLNDAWLTIVNLTKDRGPSTKHCIAMSQVAIQNLLSFFNDWLNEGLVSITIGCRWVYCLLACLDVHFSPNIHFCLRQITRYLNKCRAQMEDPFSEELPQINLIICIIGNFFSQMDLADLREST